jgi:hypothetical protein
MVLACKRLSNLMGFFRVPPQAASELTLALLEKVTVQAILLDDYLTAIREAASRGIMGGWNL